MQAVGSRLRPAPPSACIKCAEKRSALKQLRSHLDAAVARVKFLETELAAALARHDARPVDQSVEGAAGDRLGTPRALQMHEGSPLPAELASLTPVQWSGASSAPAQRSTGGVGEGLSASPGDLAAPRCLFLGSPLAPVRPNSDDLASGTEDVSCTGACASVSDDEALVPPVPSLAPCDAGTGAGACAPTPAHVLAVAPPVSASSATPARPLTALPVSAWTAEARACMAEGCGAEFGVLLWRHHCRLCGGAFCAHCSARELRLASAPVRAPMNSARAAHVDAASDAAKDAAIRQHANAASGRLFMKHAADTMQPQTGLSMERVCETCYVRTREQARARRARREAAAAAGAAAPLAGLQANAAARAPSAKALPVVRPYSLAGASAGARK